MSIQQNQLKRLSHGNPVIIKTNAVFKTVASLSKDSFYYVFTRVPCSPQEKPIYILLDKDVFDDLDEPDANKILHQIEHNLESLSVSCEFDMVKLKYIETDYQTMD